MITLSTTKNFARRNRTSKRTVSQKLKESKTAINFAMITLVCVLGLLYLAQINNNSTKGYEIGKYEKKSTEIQKENQKIMVELADLKSMRSLENESNKLSSINSADITYVVESSGAVAMQK